MRAVAGALALATVLVSCSTAPPPHLTMARLEELHSAVDSGRDLPRPRLPSTADTNAAAAYYKFAEPLVRFGPKLDTAEMALYWASRLDPAWPDPIYARAMVLVRALQHDAFQTWLKTRSIKATSHVGLSPRQVQLVDSRYSAREFARAESLFAVALRKHPEDVGVRIDRARALFFLGRYDSTVAELEAARDSVRRRAEAYISPVVISGEMFEYAIGIVRVQQDDYRAARAAFERALTANLGFYWAHARLAGAVLALGDTTTALAELDLAVQLEDHDPGLRLYHGAGLRSAGRLDEAGVQLRKAIELDPYYAAPYFWLGAVYAAQRKVQGAIEQYRLFSAHAAQADSDRIRADRALAALGAPPPAPPVVDSGRVPRHF